ncbi:hypothetical protein BH09MYX1_BH09MYX1_05590 [soil metagenome]
MAPSFTAFRTDHEALRLAQAEADDLITTVTPITEALADVIAFVEHQVPSAIGVIFAVDRECLRLRQVVGRLPPRSRAAADSITIAPMAGAAGTAAFRGENVIAADIATDASWAREGEIALADGFRACWAVPILAMTAVGRGRLVGVLALYLDRVGAPDGRALAAMMRGARLSAIAMDAERSIASAREGAARFRTFVDHAVDAFFLHGVDGRIVDANRQACLSLGYTRAELLDLTPLAFDPAITPEEHAALDARLVQGQTVTFETRHQRKDGVSFPVEISVRTFGDEGMRLAVVRDIRERKRVESALRASEETLRRAQELVHVGSWDFDPSRSHFTGSAEAWRIAGLEPGPHSLAAFRNAVNPEDLEKLDAAWNGALRGIPFEIEHRFVVGETIKWALVRAEVEYNERGVVELIRGVTQDVTARRRLEEQLRQAQKMEAIGQLAGGIAHDFNNLLTVINGFTDVVAAELPPDHPAQEDLACVREAGDRAESLTAQLLAFSRRTIVEPRILDLNEIMTRIAKILERLVGEHIRVVFRRGATSHVEADAGQVDQVLMNLAVNARDAMERGGTLSMVTRDIEVAADPFDAEVVPGRYVELAVTDTGHGMSEAVKSKIFEPFFTTKGQGKGTGLGIATVYGIVQQSGGHVKIESTVGSGTTFFIRLPAVDIAVHEELAIGRATPTGKETILLVARSSTRALAQRALEMHGYSVLFAEDAAAATVIAHEHRGPIHALVTKDDGGRSLARRLQRARPGIRVVQLGDGDSSRTPLALAITVRHALDEAR